MSLGDCPNWPECGHRAMGQCDADMSGNRPAKPTEVWSYEWQDESGAWFTAWHSHPHDYNPEMHGHRNLRKWLAQSADGVEVSRNG